MPDLILVSILGGAGALVRFVFGRWNGVLPWGILLANSLASAVAGFFFSSSLGYLAVAGFAGGLSTFSTLIAQTSGLWVKNKALAATNLALNLIIPSTAAYTFGLVSVALLK